MRELISIPGLQFQLFELHGSLTYTFTRAGRPAVQSVLSELDYVDLTRDEDSEDGMPQPKKPGLDASAVGIQVRVLKNDGQLQLDFEARDGGSAKWVFDGLSANDKTPLSASASTQTSPDPKLCVTCGRSSISPAEVADPGAQIEERVGEEASTPTNSVQNGTSVPHHKRKTSSNSRAEQSPQKRTRLGDASALPPHRVYINGPSSHENGVLPDNLVFSTHTRDLCYSKANRQSRINLFERRSK